MLDAMRRYVAEGDTEKAVAVAKDAAPYCHPRLANTKIEGDVPAVVNIVVVTVDSDAKTMRAVQQQHYDQQRASGANGVGREPSDAFPDPGFSHLAELIAGDELSYPQ
jgi:hypothetical protein